MLRGLVNKTLITSAIKAGRFTPAVRFEHQQARPLGPRNQVPEFSGAAVVEGKIKNVSYSDYKGKWLVFFFYPLDFTFVCPTEIIAFSDRVDEFRKLGCEVVACSCDSEYSHLAWVNTPRKEGGLGEMKIPVLADFSKKTARSFGVLEEKAGVAFRGLFLIDPNGQVRHSLINDLPVGRSVEEALRVLKAFQYVEQHGEVCPADWKEGENAINVKSPKDYFNKKN
ncbi:Antioxidant, AhpC/TSA family [Aphelenchoides besseyi]|nr:Antioxidant, AhpC/TSA family [Aphelenchoides besseyi]KAI6201936.1 Antioxidant, AhpC/TSA family [Aphelenchoides besseyi]